MINVNEDASGGAYGNDGGYEIWSLVGAVGCEGGSIAAAMRLREQCEQNLLIPKT